MKDGLGQVMYWDKTEWLCGISEEGVTFKDSSCFAFLFAVFRYLLCKYGAHVDSNKIVIFGTKTGLFQ